MRVVQVAAAAFCCVLVVASIPAEARGGRGRSIGPSRTIYVSGHVRTNGSYVSPQPRSVRGTVVGTSTRSGSPPQGLGAAAAFGALSGPIPGGASLVAADPHRTAYAACPAERLVGSGAGFCQIN